MNIFWAIVVFSLIILFHEFGHFLLAKLNKVTVVEFSLGMGPRILSGTWRGTRYSWKAFPFGGSCMMLGEDEEANGEGSFGSKPVWARISVIAAGPLFNFVLALLLGIIIVAATGYNPAYVVDVTEGSPAQEAGLQAGDLITRMNGRRINIGREVSLYVNTHQGQDITLTYERDGQPHTVEISPRRDGSGRYLMGVSINPYYVKASPWQAVKYGACEVGYNINVTVESLKMLVRGEAGIKDMSGPVGVVDMIGDTYTESAKISVFAIVINMMSIAVLLSANLGIVNLLPIPALDGGRLVFLILEALRGKRINPEKEAIVHFVGLMALMVLMVVVLYNDVMRLI